MAAIICVKNFSDRSQQGLLCGEVLCFIPKNAENMVFFIRI
jgi:hypothetical protein